MAARIAVTGGCGHLGQVLIEHLLAQGSRVRCIDRTPPTSAAIQDQHLGYITADLKNANAVKAALTDCDAVAHLAAIPGLGNGFSDEEVYANNTAISYNVLCAAAGLGIRHVCLASSVNAIGGAFGPTVHYQYFPVDEQHPTFAMDAYSLSKWVMEQQADAVARRNPSMAIASLRFHALPLEDPPLQDVDDEPNAPVTRTLWGFINAHAAARAVELALKASYVGHEVFFIVAPRTHYRKSSLELAAKYHPHVPIRDALHGNAGFYDCSKAERLLGWRHDVDYKTNSPE
jgi:nucleoside-diphosphate-sugar epimerase